MANHKTIASAWSSTISGRFWQFRVTKVVLNMTRLVFNMERLIKVGDCGSPLGLGQVSTVGRTVGGANHRRWRGKPPPLAGQASSE